MYNVGKKQGGGEEDNGEIEMKRDGESKGLIRHRIYVYLLA